MRDFNRHIRLPKHHDCIDDIIRKNFPMFFLHVSPSDEYRWFFAKKKIPAFFSIRISCHWIGSSEIRPAWGAMQVEVFQVGVGCLHLDIQRLDVVPQAEEKPPGATPGRGRLSERVCLCWGACDYDSVVSIIRAGCIPKIWLKYGHIHITVTLWPGLWFLPSNLRGCNR